MSYHFHMCFQSSPVRSYTWSCLPHQYTSLHLNTGQYRSHQCLKQETGISLSMSEETATVLVVIMGLFLATSQGWIFFVRYIQLNILKKNSLKSFIFLTRINKQKIDSNNTPSSNGTSHGFCLFITFPPTGQGLDGLDIMYNLRVMTRDVVEAGSFESRSNHKYCLP